MRTPDYVVWLYPDSVQDSWTSALARASELSA